MSTQQSLYDKDYYAWTVETVNKLRSKQLNDLDIDHLIEEVERIGASEIRQLSSRLEVLLMHLLKWQYQPSLQCKSWMITIKEQRARIKRLLKKMPSLRVNLESEALEAYPYAIMKAEKETGLDSSTFPNELPYTLEQLLDDNFYPMNN